MSDAPIRQLYRALLTAWNQQDAAGMAACYTADGSQVGFRADLWPDEDRSQPIEGPVSPTRGEL